MDISKIDSIYIKQRVLLLKKNKDYQDAYAELGAVGVLKDVMHKIKRAINISNRKIEIKDETIIDTVSDMINYGLLFLEQWYLNENNDTDN